MPEVVDVADGEPETLLVAEAVADRLLTVAVAAPDRVLVPDWLGVPRLDSVAVASPLADELALGLPVGSAEAEADADAEPDPVAVADRHTVSTPGAQTYWTPWAHAAQAAQAGDPGAAANVPALHMVHTGAPAGLLYVPTAHTVQPTVPVTTAEYAPAAHPVHSDAPVWLL